MDFAPFPTGLLPCPMRNFVAEAAEAMGVDEAFVALPLLAAAASAVGTTRQVRLKKTWAEPAVLWVALVAPGGTVKSAPLDLAMTWVRRRQEGLLEATDETDDEDAGGFPFKLPKGFPNIGLDPDPPPQPPEHVFTGDVTLGALVQRLANSPRGLIVVMDELAGWLGRSLGGGEGAHWSRMHRAAPVKIDRNISSATALWIPRAAVSVCGGIQPRALRRFLRPEFLENGLAAQLLVAMPPMKPKVWNDAEVSEQTLSAMGRLFDKLYALEPAPGADAERDSDENAPQDVLLDGDAREAWIRFFDAHNRQQRELGDTDLAAAFSKLEGYAARLALVIHCCRAAVGDRARPLVLDAASLEAGVALSLWFGGEARRVYDQLATDPGEWETDRLIDFIVESGGEITEKQLRDSSRKLKSAGAATAALESLIGAKMGQWIYARPSDNGGRPARRFRLTPAINPDGAGSPEPVESVPNEKCLQNGK